MEPLKENIGTCPHCHKSGPEISLNVRFRKGTANRRMYWIRCGYCGAEQRHDNLSGFRTPSRAIRNWNSSPALTTINK